MASVVDTRFAPLLSHQLHIFVPLVNVLTTPRANEHRSRFFRVRTSWMAGVSQTNITHCNKFSNLSENSVDFLFSVCYNVLVQLRTRTRENKCSTLGLLKKQQILTASVNFHRFIPHNLKYSENLFIFTIVAKSLIETSCSSMY